MRGNSNFHYVSTTVYIHRISGYSGGIHSDRHGQNVFFLLIVHIKPTTLQYLAQEARQQTSWRINPLTDYTIFLKTWAKGCRASLYSLGFNLHWLPSSIYGGDVPLFDVITQSSALLNHLLHPWTTGYNPGLLATPKAVSETTNRQIESVNREREWVATLLFFEIHYRISLSTITFEFRTISVSFSPLIFLQR
jgi:hypothetical protein